MLQILWTKDEIRNNVSTHKCCYFQYIKCRVIYLYTESFQVRLKLQNIGSGNYLIVTIHFLLEFCNNITTLPRSALEVATTANTLLQTRIMRYCILSTIVLPLLLRKNNNFHLYWVILTYQKIMKTITITDSSFLLLVLKCSVWS